MSLYYAKLSKIYFCDSGLLHALLQLESAAAVERHPKLGASWEGFALSSVIDHLEARPEECYFWATHAGAELDLFVILRGRRLGFEFKRTDAPKATPSMQIAMEDLKLDRLDVVHAGERTFPLTKKIRAVALTNLLTGVGPG